MIRSDGLPLRRFAHYTYNAGENRGEPVTFLSKSELSRTMNVEQRGRGITPRQGSSVLNNDSVTGFPDPISAGDPINSGTGFTYGQAGDNIDIFSIDESVYKNATAPFELRNGLEPAAKFQFAKSRDVAYMSNGSDPVLFFQPGRDDEVLFTSGYDTPSAFTAAMDATVSTRAAGTYEYYVTLYDQTTNTESDSQLLAVSVTIGANESVELDNLPLDPEDRTTHWRIYRKDPTGYYHYDLIQITYDALNRDYIDSITSTGRTRTAPSDNARPDVSTSICLHGKVMLFGKGITLSWSKPFRYQNVPTFNREYLDDDSSDITKIVSFKSVAVVFKERSIYVISGNFVTGEISLSRISREIGTVSPDSVWVDSDGIFFFGSDGKPRFINSTDFQTEDLREDTDISYKYRDKFDNISPADYSKVFAVNFKFRRWNQYRVFVPIDNPNYASQVFVFDKTLARINGSESSWFTFRYNINMISCWISRTSGQAQRLCVGDDYSLIWALDKESQYYDGYEFERLEGDGTVTYGASTVTISNATMDVNQYVGMQLVLYDAFTFNEIFRSKIISNTATEFTCQDTIPGLPTTNPYITIGGYLTLFATAHYTQDRAGRFRPFAISLLLSQDVGVSDIYFFINYDFSETFNYVYDYINNPLNESATPRGDTYLIALGESLAIYGLALFDASNYGNYLYDTTEFELNSKYLANHASWGIITREPSRPFIYLGSTFFYQYKGLTRPSTPT